MDMEFKELIEKENHYFSEGHLMAYFKSMYLGKSKDYIENKLSNEHDTSLEVENAENEIGRNLTPQEEVKLINKFNESILENIEFIDDVAVAYRDSLNELNIS